MVSAINYPDGEDSQESQVPLDEETQLEEGTERLPDLEDRDSSSDEEEADPSSTHRHMARKKNKKERSNSTTAHPAHLTLVMMIETTMKKMLNCVYQLDLLQFSHSLVLLWKVSESKKGGGFI